MSRFFTIGLLCVLAVSLGLSGAAAQEQPAAEWPQWRGPNRDGVSADTGLLRQWPAGGPPLVWKATGLGSGYSSISLADGRIYTMGDRQDACYLLALDARTGKEVWAARVGEPKGGGGYPGPRCTPTADGDLVFALGQHGDLVCVRAADGREVWRKNYSTDYGGKKDENWGCSESPLVDGNRLICTPGGKSATMVALDKRTGKEVWKCLVPGCRAGHSSAVVAEVGGVRHYVQLTTGGVIGVRAKDGQLLWKYTKFTPNTANIPTCIVRGDEVFCSAGYRNGGGALLKLTPTGDGGITMNEVYCHSELHNKHGGWVRVGDYLYGDRDDRGQPRCVEWKTGKVVWAKEGRSAGSGSAAITYADGHLYIRYQNGVVVLVAADPNGGYQEKSSFKIPRTEGGPSWPHLVVVGGRLYVREQDQLLCYDVRQK
jgi:outer membrane protein assembly factor BamB